MPGHKGGNHAPPQLIELLGEKAFLADLTEVAGLDNLHNPQGVIREAQKLAAACFGAKATFFLVNGASAGIQAALLSLCRSGDVVIAPRNAHLSFLNGLILSGAVPAYAETEYTDQGIPLPLSARALEKAIGQYPQARVVFLVSPTYEGLCINYAELLPVAKAAGLKVIVDEAHGAHFYFNHHFPRPALAYGADMVIHGSHKTLGSLTQTGMLHVTDLGDADKVQKALSLVQSTSPSYLLMASLDGARAHLEQQGQELLSTLVAMCEQVRREINCLPGYWCLARDHLQAWPQLGYDPTKLVIGSLEGLSGYQLEEKLNLYNIDLEMARSGYVLALAGLGDNKENLAHLVKALKEIGERGDLKGSENYTRDILPFSLPPVVLSPREAYFAGYREVDLLEAAGELSGEMIAPYPPGIPLICPGERFTSEIIEYIQKLRKQQSKWQGSADATLKKVRIIER